jgi:hypothetical protein
MVLPVAMAAAPAISANSIQFVEAASVKPLPVDGRRCACVGCVG